MSLELFMVWIDYTLMDYIRKFMHHLSAFFLLMTTFPLFASDAGNIINAANQFTQERAREQALRPDVRSVDSSITYRGKDKVVFPAEINCWRIRRVEFSVDNGTFPLSFLKRVASQAHDKCLGVEGIYILGKVLQNEMINQGYITSYIDVPKQELSSGVLTYSIAIGRIGDISLTPQSQQYITLGNSLPFSHGDILNLRDMERGAENLQRIPDTQATMHIVPGTETGTSDITIARQQSTFLQPSLWLNDAGSRQTGRYQGGGALYFYNPTSLNDIFYLSGGRDLAFDHRYGSHNASIGYSVPWDYWTLSLYGSRSQYQQPLSGAWGEYPFLSKQRYLSAEFNRLLSHTREQKTSAALSLFKGTSRYYLDDIELGVMHKQNPGWKLSLQHQRYFRQATLLTSIAYQDRLDLLASTPTPEEQAMLVSPHARMVTLDMQALMKFDLTGPDFSYAPHFNLQISPDELTQQNRLAIGNRWTVRGFDGENTLTQNQGWTFSNDFIWHIPATTQQLYAGLDMGRIIGDSNIYDGKMIAGSTLGIKGKKWQTTYDVFIGAPLYKPEKFATDDVTMGFSLQWQY